MGNSPYMSDMYSSSKGITIPGGAVLTPNSLQQDIVSYRDNSAQKLLLGFFLGLLLSSCIGMPLGAISGLGTDVATGIGIGAAFGAVIFLFVFLIAGGIVRVTRTSSDALVNALLREHAQLKKLAMDQQFSKPAPNPGADARYVEERFTQLRNTYNEEWGRMRNTIAMSLESLRRTQMATVPAYSNYAITDPTHPNYTPKPINVTPVFRSMPGQQQQQQPNISLIPQGQGPIYSGQCKLEPRVVKLEQQLNQLCGDFSTFHTMLQQVASAQGQSIPAYRAPTAAGPQPSDDGHTVPKTKLGKLKKSKKKKKKEPLPAMLPSPVKVTKPVTTPATIQATPAATKAAAMPAFKKGSKVWANYQGRKWETGHHKGKPDWCIATVTSVSGSGNSAKYTVDYEKPYLDLVMSQEKKEGPPPGGSYEQLSEADVPLQRIRPAHDLRIPGPDLKAFQGERAAVAAAWIQEEMYKFGSLPKDMKIKSIEASHLGGEGNATAGGASLATQGGVLLLVKLNYEKGPDPRAPNSMVLKGVAKLKTTMNRDRPPMAPWMDWVLDLLGVVNEGNITEAWAYSKQGHTLL